jgi:hypothetical protein
MAYTNMHVIYCCGCECDIEARLTNGKEIYPHRTDLYSLPFWKCDECGGYVGCHHKTKNRTRPLGCISTKELRNARRQIHKILDPLWKTGGHKRKALYVKISESIGWSFHTSELKTLDQARQAYKIIKKIGGLT